MTDIFADLHIHSYYSDGTMSPTEILETARNKNVGLISINLWIMYTKECWSLLMINQ